MISTLLHLLRLFPFLCGGHRQLALENLALRQQLAVYKRTATRPKLGRRDRLFWVCAGQGVGRLAAGPRHVIVTPDTVLRWQRRRFRDHWTTLSGRPPAGRPTGQRRGPRPGRTHGRGQSPLGCPQNPWRTPEARHRRRRAHRLPAAPEAAFTRRRRPGARSSPTTSETRVDPQRRRHSLPRSARPASRSSNATRASFTGLTEVEDGRSSHRGGNPSILEILAQLTLMFLLPPVATLLSTTRALTEAAAVD